jgi:hypothetical protein
MQSKAMPPRASERFEDMLVRQYGAVIGGQDLRAALGFKSTTAFCRAVRAERLPIRLFHMPGRRGRFALATDVAEWLEKRAEAGCDDRAGHRAKAGLRVRRNKKEGTKM